MEINDALRSKNMWCQRRPNDFGMVLALRAKGQRGSILLTLLDGGIMTQVSERRRLGQQLSVLASIKGVSQVTLARECRISRISINRFFRGRSELKAGDLLRVLTVLGIDIHAVIEGQLRADLMPLSSSLGSMHLSRHPA